jgi:hypothetical protein
MIRYSLHIERLGPLPLINHFIERMGLDVDGCDEPPFFWRPALPTCGLSR